MKPSDPIPRLLRLHAMARQTAPADGQDVSDSDAVGLSEAYESLRASTRRLAIELGIAADEFDIELPELDKPQPVTSPSPEAFMKQASQASAAATRLSLLTGYLEGLIEMTFLTEDLTTDQVTRVRGALSR